MLTRCWKVEKSQKQHGDALGREKAKGQRPEARHREHSAGRLPTHTCAHQGRRHQHCESTPALSRATAVSPPSSLIPVSPPGPPPCRIQVQASWQRSLEDVIRRLLAPHNERRIWESRDGAENQTTGTTTLLISWFRTQLRAN